jgi:O-antigen/teichoic acid export membrane protein
VSVQATDRLARRHDYVTTFAAEGLFILSYLAVFRIVADHFGPTGFGEYALARRTLAFLLPVGAIGLDVAIARYVAYAAGRPHEQRAYLPAALGLLAVSVSVQGVILLAFQRFWADVFFGSSTYSGLVPPLALLVAGNALFAVAYGNLRGHLRITQANALRVLVHAALPLGAALLTGGSVSSLLYVMGGGWTVLSLGALGLTRMSIDKPMSRAAELARYSVPRAPGDLLALVLFALPGIVVAHASDITVAGEVAFGIAALGMIASAVFPVGFLLLPVASRLLAAGDTESLRSQVVAVARLVVSLIFAGIVVFEAFATPIVTIYLGPAFAGSVATLRIIMLGALPWGLYISLRSVIDARHKRAINALNVAAAFILFAGVMLILRPFVDPARVVVPVFVVSLYLLGALTVIEVWRITRGEVTAPAPDYRSGAVGEEASEPML